MPKMTPVRATMKCNVCGDTVEVPHKNSNNPVHCDNIDWGSKPRPKGCTRLGIFEVDKVTYAMDFDAG